MTKDMVKVELDSEVVYEEKAAVTQEVQKIMHQLELQKKENDKLGQSYKTIKNEIQSKKIRHGPWRSCFGNKLQKLLKEIIQINYD